MLIIRNEQKKALSVLTMERFATRMIDHLGQHFPGECASLGEAGTEEVVHHGIGRALEYGLETEQHICKYLSVMFAFHRDFDTDPELPWASEILCFWDANEFEPKADRLVSAALLHQEQAVGISQKKDYSNG